jgi:hypothetical protein
MSVTPNKSLIKFNYTLHGHPFESLEEARHLGPAIRQDLRWKSHVNNICTKTNKILGFLPGHLNISLTSVKEQAYTYLVKPSVEFYACSAWDP